MIKITSGLVLIKWGVWCHFPKMTSPVHLKHRCVLSVLGGDAVSFLQGLVTCSVTDMGDGDVRHGALLTPQGKVLADMLVFGTSGGFLLECDRDVASDLLKRLSMFRLRADVKIEMRDDLCSVAFAGVADPRSGEAPARSVVAVGACPAEDDVAGYHSARITAGLAEQGHDFSSGEVFPADINMDVLGGVAFQKGCFVGQEVVSRMKRRGTARRRTLVAHLEGAVEAPVDVLAGENEIGSLTSVAGDLGLVRVRTDRLAQALDAGLAVTAGGVGVRIGWPEWLVRDDPASSEA